MLFFVVRGLNSQISISFLIFVMVFFCILDCSQNFASVFLARQWFGKNTPSELMKEQQLNGNDNYLVKCH